LKAFEIVCVTVGLPALPATGAAAVLGVESAPLGAGLTLAAVALLYLVVVGWKVREQGVPFWCSSGSSPAGWFHRFKEAVDTEKARI